MWWLVAGGSSLLTWFLVDGVTSSTKPIQFASNPAPAMDFGILPIAMIVVAVCSVLGATIFGSCLVEAAKEKRRGIE